ncbi:hypothetical protein K440DRAFT_678878 [Wilcoxina mikolae CBS 423.85]|nr:hypothetical protein K440DRAFT_678878 [Wilcoxina mikolae CBS 423.85]
MSSTSDPHPTPTEKRGKLDRNRCRRGLVATVIGVFIAAIGVFGWKCWRGHRNAWKTQHDRVPDESADGQLADINPPVPVATAANANTSPEGYNSNTAPVPV